MRIALFTDTYAPTVNGVARALGLLVRHAVRAGHEVALVTPTLSDRAADHVALHVQLPSVTVPFYEELQAARLWLGPRNRRALDSFAPDLVHAATEASVGWVGRRWALARAIPLVTSYCTNFAEYVHGYRLGALEGVVWRLLERFHGAARITFCPSEATRTELAARGFQRLRIWSRGVDAVQFNPSCRSEDVRREMAPGAEVILAYVGRVAPEKRIDLLMRAFPRIREGTERKVALVLVGDGPALEDLRRRNVEGVHFTGYQQGERLAACYASADVFVFPSDTETFGQVVTEAFASGLPSVVPDRGGVKDLVIPGETGFRFPPGDAEAFASAALRLIDDDALRRRMSLNARRVAETRSWDDVFQRLFSHYHDALSPRHGLVTGPHPDVARGTHMFPSDPDGG
ncbi:MAG TPA: glycosyltransferase family 1 protein [Longimicrobiales bacterium]